MLKKTHKTYKKQKHYTDYVAAFNLQKAVGKLTLGTY